MNTDELRTHVKSLPEDVRNKFVKKEFENQSIVTKESIKDFFDSLKTVAEVKEFFAKFDDESIVSISSEIDYGYYEGEENAELEANVVSKKLETDDELTNRILTKVKRVEKQLFKEKENVAKALVRKNIKPL